MALRVIERLRGADGHGQGAARLAVGHGERAGHVPAGLDGGKGAVFIDRAERVGDGPGEARIGGIDLVAVVPAGGGQLRRAAAGDAEGGKGGVLALMLDGDGGERFRDGEAGRGPQTAGRGRHGRGALRAVVDSHIAAARGGHVRAAEGDVRRDGGRHVAAVRRLDGQGDLRVRQRIAAEGVEVELRGRARVLLLADEEDEVRAFAQLAVGGDVGRRAGGVAGVGDARGRRAAAVKVQRGPAAERLHPLGQLRERQTLGVASLVAGVEDERAVVLDADGGAGGHFLGRVEGEVGADAAVFDQYIAAAAGGGDVLPAGGAGDLDGQLLAHDQALERSKGVFIDGIVGDGEQEPVFGDGAGFRILHHADDFDRQCLAEPQLRRARAGRADDDVVALDGVLGAGVIVL